MSLFHFRLLETPRGRRWAAMGPLGKLRFSGTSAGAGDGRVPPPTDFCGCGFSYILLAGWRFRVGGVHKIEVHEIP